MIPVIFLAIINFIIFIWVLISIHNIVKCLKELVYQSTLQTNMIRDIAIKINPSEYGIKEDESEYDDEEDDDEYEEDDTEEE